jgi:hypothetical protein
MDDKRIAELREICEAATDGWCLTNIEGDTFISGPVEGGYVTRPSEYRRDYDQHALDNEFIAEARTALPEALDEIARLKGEVAVLERALEKAAATIRYLEPDDTGSRAQLIAQAKEQARKELEDK